MADRDSAVGQITELRAHPSLQWVHLQVAAWRYLIRYMGTRYALARNAQKGERIDDAKQPR